jgi:AbrB family looped-hinge helix DNA binding protein
MSSIVAQVSAGGRIVIPAEIRRKMDIHSGDQVILSYQDGELHITTRKQRMQQAKAIVKVVMENLELQIEPLDEKQAWQTGMLRMSTREFGLSLGDRACLALAHVKKLSIVTANKQWDKLKTDIKIIQLR